MVWWLAVGCVYSGVPDTGRVDPTRDMRGVYAVAWEDTVRVSLDLGGATQQAELAPDGVATFDGPDGVLEIDLGAYCADEGIVCPAEVWATAIGVDQVAPEQEAGAHALRAWDMAAPEVARDGIVTHVDHRFLFGIGASTGGDDTCGALELSLADGTFRVNADGPTGIDDGRVVAGWLGVCAWPGLAVVATLSVEARYSADRTGDL